MLPTTFVGLLGLIVLALPGYVYYRARARARPEQVTTTLQELLGIFFVGAAVDSIALVVGALASRYGLVPPFDGAAFVRDSRGYVASHLPLTVWWLTGTVALAVLLAALLGFRAWRWLTPKRLRQAADERDRREAPQQSAWWLLFNERPEARLHVGCVVDDGTYVSGELHSYSKAGEERENRELTLRGEISYRPPGSPDESILKDVNAVAIAASHISLLMVTYVVEAETDRSAEATRKGTPFRPASSSLMREG
jgi:hypothetical protein